MGGSKFDQVLNGTSWNQPPFSPPGSRPAFFISAATYSAARRYSGVPALRPFMSFEARVAMWAKALAPSATGRTAALRGAAPAAGKPAETPGRK